MPRTGLLPRVVLGLALMLIPLAAATPVAGAEVLPSPPKVDSPWTWTNYGPDLRDVSCAAPDECVAVGQQGMVLRSDPREAAPLAWSSVPLKFPNMLAGVTCNKSFCLAVSNSLEESATYPSKVYRSDDDGATWSGGVELPEATVTAKTKSGTITVKTRSATAIACKGDDCDAVGPDGGIWRSADGGGKWEALDGPAKVATYQRIACPVEGTCIAVGGTGKGDESSALIEDAKVIDVKLPPMIGAGIGGLACDTATRCTITDGLGNYVSIMLPEKKWGTVKEFPKSAPVSALSCPLENVCDGLSGALTLRTVDLGDAAPKWQKRPLGSLNVSALDCVAADCVAIGKKASWWTSFGDGFDWDNVNEVAKMSAIDCPAAFAGTCVAGGEETIGVTRSGGRFWSVPMPEATALDVKGVKCTGESECLVLGKNEPLFTNNLIGFVPRQPPILEAKGTDAQTCITGQICVGINGGAVYTTLDGARTNWIRSAFRGGKPAAVGCVPDHLAPAECLAIAGEAMLLGTMTHTDDGDVRWNWRFTTAEPEEKLTAVGCAPGGECFAVGTGGEVLKSQGTHLMDWDEFVLPSPEVVPALRPAFSSVECPADGVCLVGGTHGDKAVIASTTKDWADYSIDEIEGVEGAAPDVEGIGCESVDKCVGVGGTSLVGVRQGASPRRR